MTNIVRRIFQPFHPVALDLQRRLGYPRTPEFRVRNGRPEVHFRGLGADEWDADKRVIEALRIADMARQAMVASEDKKLARRSEGAIVVVLVDERVVPGGVAAAEYRLVVQGKPGQRAFTPPLLG